jgi:hypothetical protein
MTVLRNIACVLSVGMLVLLCSLLAAETHPPSTPAERQHAIELTKWLEEHPLDKDTKKNNTELLTWWTEVPDVDLDWCANILLEHKNKKASFVVLQATFGGGAYILQNPGSLPDPHAVATAGVESALRAYENARAVDPAVKDSFLEGLLKKRDAGALADYVTPAVKKCKEASK